MEETSEINENEINLNPSTYTLSCIACPYIPSIQINTNQYSINVECENNIKISSENNNISGHFHDKILLEDYLLKIRANIENNKKMCSLCKNNIDIENIYYCSFCKAFICEKCLNNKHIKEKNDHPSLKFNLINVCCCIHKKLNKFYCKNCFRNICEDCLNNNKLHKDHDIVNLNDILIDDNYFKKINEEIKNEENDIKIMTKKFEKYINFIQKKFDDYIQLRNDEINLKKNILNTYEKNKNNYNSINNIKKLKFDYFKFNIEKDMDKNNLSKLKNFKKLINELILYEETKYNQKNKEEENKSKINVNNDNNNNLNILMDENDEEKKEEKKIKCYKENILLKSSKYEIVNKINMQNVSAERVLSLKNDKLLIAFTNRMIIIYEKNDLKNFLKQLCSVNLSSTKILSVRSHICNFKGIFQLKNEDLLISMSGLSNFILRVNYITKTFSVVQEFMISRGLKVNNPLFANLPPDPNNYDDIIPIIGKNPGIIYNNIQNNKNYKSEEINKDNKEGKDNKENNEDTKNKKENDEDIKNKDNLNNINDNNINNNDRNKNNDIHGINNNLNNNPINIFNNATRIVNPFRLIPHGIPIGPIANRINLPIHHIPNANNINRVNNIHQRRRNLLNLVALPNDDLLALSNKDCWILRKNSIKYVAFKDQIIHCDKIVMIKNALPISDNEFVVEVKTLDNKPKHFNPIVRPMSKKNNFVYIFFNLNYEEISRVNLQLFETMINSDNDFIYINDFHTLLLMNIKNKQIINIIELDSLGPIITIKNNKSFIIQEKENNAIVEYRIVNNEVIRFKNLIENKKVKLLAGLKDPFNTLIIQYKNDSLLFLQ